MKNLKLYWKFYLYYIIAMYGIIDGLVAWDIKQLAIFLCFGGLTRLWHTDYTNWINVRDYNTDLLFLRHKERSYYEKTAECYLENCRRAMKNMSMLKTLNKGLMRDNQQLRKENLYLKKNTYAKHTYGRTDKNRTTSGIE